MILAHFHMQGYNLGSKSLYSRGYGFETQATQSHIFSFFRKTGKYPTDYN